jgi:hypothetical protein
MSITNCGGHGNFEAITTTNNVQIFVTLNFENNDMFGN